MKNSRDMKRHIMAHTGEKPFGCEFCDYKCNLKVQLKGHMIRNHGIFNQKLRSSTHFQIFFVLIVLQIFPIKLGAGQYGCLYCDKVMKNAKDMRKHIMVHTGEKPFSCDFCDYRSTQKVHLKSHMIKHHSISTDSPNENQAFFKMKNH